MMRFALAFLSLATSSAWAGICTSKEMKFKDGTFEVTVSHVSGKQPSGRLILIYPPTGKTNLIDRSYARRLCRSGFDVYIFESWTDDEEENYDLEIHQRFYSRALRAAETVLANVPSRFVGVLGTSVGGLFTEVVASSIDRVDAAFSIVGGLSIPEVVVYSDHPTMRKLRRERYKRYGFKTAEEYLAALEKVYPLEPTRMPKKFEGKDLAIVIGTRDTVVPAKTQNQLRDFWQPRMILEFNNNHFLTIVKTWLFYPRQVAGFFQESAERKLR